MRIEELERRYQILAGDFRAGKIDEVTFALALDKLQFQDEWGRYWMIGSQTGAWYCYDGQDWRQANPHETALPTPELTQVYEIRPSMRRKSTFGLGAVLVLILALLTLPLLILPVAGAPPMAGLALAPSPRPPIGGTDDGSGGGGGSGSGKGSDHGSSGPQGAIFGTVTDLSLKQPGAGIEVSVNGAIVRTDTNGGYSITGLPAGTYTVAPQLQGQGKPAQAPVFVNLDGQSRAIIDLAYYSQGQPLPTDTPQAVVSNVPLPTPPPAATPPALPTAGAPDPPNHPSFIIAGLGLVLMTAGSILLKTHVKNK